MIIKLVDFSTILPIWQNMLWAGRVSDIKPYSAMMFMGDNSGRFKELEQRFIAAYDNDKIIAVNSLHLAELYMARSRGLWVDPNYRGQGLGTAILIETSSQAALLGAQAIWSFPRQSSWNTYHRSGYIRTSSWMDHGEFGPNCYAIKRLKD